ncbi:hypothetical protein J4455_03490 [Candidatus Woesearchaeota archaeon]|nr:hypothetical protein [Candidatus Woesearchaeota archaeon]
MEEIFRDLGFSEREIKVYLALLELGATTVGPIAAKTRLQHSKVYQTLEKLIDKGLVSFIIKSKTKYFQAQDPKQILNILKEKEKRFSEILPKLKEKQKYSKEKQIATVYEGYKAIKSMFDFILEELNNKSYYYVFAFKDDYLTSELASRFLRGIHMQLSEKKVDDRLIANISIKKEFERNYLDIKDMKYKFTNINLPLGLMIINDRVINWVWGERPTAIEIVSKQIAQQYKKFFLEIWKISKP